MNTTHFVRFPTEIVSCRWETEFHRTISKHWKWKRHGYQWKRSPSDRFDACGFLESAGYKAINEVYLQMVMTELGFEESAFRGWNGSGNCYIFTYTIKTTEPILGGLKLDLHPE